MGYRIELAHFPARAQAGLRLTAIAERNGLPREYGIRAVVGSATAEEALALMFLLDARGISYEVKEAPEWERK